MLKALKKMRELEISRAYIRWYCDGLPHKEIGPSAIYFGSGCQDNVQYWIHGKLHRLDGPAVNFSNGRKRWYYEGKKIDCSTQEEFERILKLMFLW